MSLKRRLYVLGLGVAAAAGWLAGLAFLPLVAWAAIEVVATAIESARQPARLTGRPASGR